MNWRIGWALMLVTAAGCVHYGRTPKENPTATAKSLGPFTPGRADPVRKARLVAVAPRLDELYRRQLKESGATGLVVGVILEGELVYTGAFGVRDVDSMAPVDADTVFRIASLTKSFTAAAVLRLRDEGRLALDAAAATYAPELGALVAPTRDGPPITLRHLLTHASGLPYDDYWGVETFGMDGDQLTAMIRAGVVVADVAGVRYAYSNLGYALLGRIVERVSGIGFRSYVTAGILQPLGMTATVWEARDVPAARLAVGYRRDGDRLVAEPRPSDGAFAAAGGLYTSLRDYSRYAAFQLGAYPPRDDPESGPLRRSTVREMHQGQRWSRWRGDDVPVVKRTADGGLSMSAASYGLGWLNNTTCDEEGIVQHGGYEPGYWSTVHLLPRHGLAIVTLATTEPVGFRSFDGALALLREGGALPAPAAPPAAPALVTALGTLGRLLDRWDAALVEQAFDRPSLGFYWLANLRADLEKLTRAHGACHADGPVVALGRSSGSQRLACAHGSIELKVLLTPSRPERIETYWSKELTAESARDSDSPCAR